ncbi:MAG: 23S rRNA (pseudouridine(1915)-N(3))-methyltransferase RlmH [Leptolyngbyaceae cyanobacterium SM1_1_3]|nr:23S rRNA (pseudouridine(1915)-N(3))-methyltransferase RlmH [Leptolyngbyaceae cyanobacterium SM1_1_3]NJN02958.1 23S rRNA (pseudouridine(1915)-N(3))-methyltransferase RlmH [Leptolyngbyaceae cyanobacterium RM1_1_2]NJO08841.1 23S rRNA (pseudouridine(1915)-N(3))-methyltransferase RlmH [Leptolyngbyaceae cyanobacterium SL_1_1]
MPSFPKVRLIAVGKVKKGWLRDGLEVYCRRLPELEITEIKDSTPEKEGDQILSLLKSSDRLIALSAEGQMFSSIEFADFLSKADSHSLVFAIGSAEGLSTTLKQSAVEIFSLSPMTLPHEIARLILVEQIYRAKTILQGSQYHK